MVGRRRGEGPVSGGVGLDQDPSVGEGMTYGVGEDTGRDRGTCGPRKWFPPNDLPTKALSR